MSKKLNILIFLPFLISTLIVAPQQTFAVDSSGEWAAVDSMAETRFGHSAILLQNGKVLVTSGRNSFNSNVASNTSEIYDPISKTWSESGSINQGRYMNPPSMVTLPDGRVLTAGGWGTGDTDLSSTEIYDPTTGTWSFIANTNTPRRLGVLAPLSNGKILLTSGAKGGPAPGRQLASAEIYDPNSNTWNTTNPMNYGRDSNELFLKLADGSIMIAGGESVRSTAENTAEIFNPASEQWELSIMPYAMRAGALTTLKDGRVLLTGGYNGSQVVTSAAIYDPISNTWTSIASMNIPRQGHISFLLSDGKVLISGGNNGTTYLKSTEIYDPSTNTWLSGFSLPENVAGGIATQLENGDYLLTGGTNGNSVLSSAYLFTTPNSNLNVPLFKQGVVPFDDGSPIWEFAEFDSAFDGQFTCGSTMATCGCSTTSMAMVLKSFGIDNLPSGEALDPGTLNTWLKNTPGGYNRNLGINWAVAATVAHKAKAQNENFEYNSLEYSPNTTFSPTSLTEDLENNLPNILQVNAPGMHFVVAKGIEDNTFTINDPLFSHTDLTAYNNIATSVRRFVPANSDMSYITYFVDPNVTIEVKDENGNSVGESYFEYSPSNLTVYPSLIDSSAIKVFYFAKPTTGTYTVELSSNITTRYQLDETLISEEGNIKTDTFTGFLGPDFTNEFTLSFNKVIIDDTETTKFVTYQSTLEDIKQAEEQGLIKHGLAQSLSSMVENAEKNEGKNMNAARSLLENGIRNLEKNEGNDDVISPAAYEILHYDLTTLRGVLN